MMHGGLSNLGVQPVVDPLFQIDEKKKYIGFLEESDEETSQSDDLISMCSSDDEEESISSFMEKIERYEKKVKADTENQEKNGFNT